MVKFRCTVCNYVYNEDQDGKRFSDLSAGWRCPVCGAPKNMFVLLTEKTVEKKMGMTVSDVFMEQVAEWGVKYVFGIPGNINFRSGRRYKEK